MPDLAAFQRDFAAALMDDGRRMMSSAFDVYRNTVARGAVEALRAAYPTVDMLVGDEMFTDVALDYRRQRPPPGPVLSDYGTDFPDWLARQPWSSELPYLADVARVDRMWLETFFAPEGGDVRLGWFDTPGPTIWLAHRAVPLPKHFEPEWRAEGAISWRDGANVLVRAIDSDTYRQLVKSKGADHGHIR